MRTAWVCGVVFAVLGCSSCGSSSGGGPVLGPVQQLVAPPQASIDGWIWSNGSVNQGCGGVGDVDATANGRSSRMFLSFDISDLPPGAAIVSATLALYQDGSLGADPFITHGGAGLIDHVDIGATLTGSDYANGLLSAAVATVPQAVPTDYGLADVTMAVHDDVSNARTRSQFRIRFPTASNGDGVTQLRLIRMADDNCAGGPDFGGPPLLIIDYR